MENLLIKNGLLTYELKTFSLDDFAMDMIKENENLNCLIPLRYLSIPSNSIQFDTSNFVSLYSLLENPLDIKIILTIFIQICEIVNYTKIHMLYENNLVLEPENIFFDENSSKVKMLYIPVDEFDTPHNFRNFFKELLLDLETDDLQISSSIFKKINKKPLDLTELLEFLKLTENKLLSKDISNNKNITKEDVVIKSNISIEPIQLENSIVDTPIKFEETLDNIDDEVTTLIEESPIIQPKLNDYQQDIEYTSQNIDEKSTILQNVGELEEVVEEESISPLESFMKNIYENQPYDSPMQNIDVPIDTNTEEDEDMLDIQRFLETNQEDDDNSYNNMMAQLFTPQVKDTPSNKDSVAKIIRMKDNSTMTISKKYFIIGASSHTDFTITDNPQISRSHATIICENNSYYISDNGSSNGTCVNGKKIKQLDKIKLKHKDIITLASDEKIMFYLD